jgi:hypothetical protein
MKSAPQSPERPTAVAADIERLLMIDDAVEELISKMLVILLGDREVAGELQSMGSCDSPRRTPVCWSLGQC